MSGVASRALGCAVVVGLATPLACFGGGGGCVCDTRSQDEIHFESLTARGFVDWVYDLPIADRDPPVEGTCSAELRLEAAFCGEGGPPSTSMSVDVECRTHEGVRGSLSTTLGDVRNLEVGDYPMSVRHWDALSDVSFEASLHIEASTGSGGDFPNVVSDDFSKTVRLDVVSDVLNASLEFELRADQFVSKPNSPCRLCLC